MFTLFRKKQEKPMIVAHGDASEEWLKEDLNYFKSQGVRTQESNILLGWLRNLANSINGIDWKKINDDDTSELNKRERVLQANYNFIRWLNEAKCIMRELDSRNVDYYFSIRNCVYSGSDILGFRGIK